VSGDSPRPSGAPGDRSSADTLTPIKDGNVFRGVPGELSTIGAVMSRHWGPARGKGVSEVPSVVLLVRDDCLSLHHNLG